jgi:hypothetical protein
MNITDAFTGGEKPRSAFAHKLSKTLSVQSDALTRLHSALSYVQSKEELGQLLNTFRRTVADKVGGYARGPICIPSRTCPALAGRSTRAAR